MLPGAVVYVFDNMSTDRTAELARAAGAIVVPARRPGKGSVVRKMFSEVDADIYLMVDGDATYEVEAAPAMIELLQRDALDMVIGARVPSAEDGEEYPAGHTIGNRVFSMLYRRLFESDIEDAFSGVPGHVTAVREVVPRHHVRFRHRDRTARPRRRAQVGVRRDAGQVLLPAAGSQSKLGTYSDGIKILWSAIRLFRDLRPKRFFGIGALDRGRAAALILGVPVIEEYLETGLVLAVPDGDPGDGAAAVARSVATCGLIISLCARGAVERRRVPGGAAATTPLGRHAPRSPAGGRRRGSRRPDPVADHSR